MFNSISAILIYITDYNLTLKLIKKQMFYVRKVIIVCFVYLQYTDKTVYCKCKGVVNYMWNTFDNCKQKLIEMNHFGDYKNGMSSVQLKEKTEVLIEKYKSISVSGAKSEIIAFILKNAEIRICEDDIFVSQINHAGVMWDFQQQMRFETNCGDISEFINIPVEIISCIFISLSITINAPFFCFDSSTAAIAIL